MKMILTALQYYVWPPRTTALGRLLWQANINGLMTTILIFFAAKPLLALPLLLSLVGVSMWVHGRWAAKFAPLCGVAGWLTEVFLQWAGPMWQFGVIEPFNPTGVPLYMIAGWALVGLFSVALADFMRERG